MSERANDVVVFGATGFTGVLISEYLARSAPPEVRWAIAGRDERKLFALKERLGGARCPPSAVIIADVADAKSLREMAESARVVLTTVGPYMQYGEPVVRAAIEAGSDYVDLTGEPAFMDRCIDEYDAKARDRGVKIVNSCGFESVPDDLGALFCARELPRGVPMTIEAYLRTRSTFSGGTWHSAIGIMSTSRETSGARRRRPRPSAGDRRVRRSKTRIKWVREIDAWAVPMPTIENDVVLRSARALDVYGPDFRFGHFLRVRNLSAAVGVVAGAGALFSLTQLAATRDLLLRVKKPGDGPSEAQRAKSWFEITFVGEAGSSRVVSSVSGGDPGYGDTSKIIAESALCLARDRASLPQRFGVITPAMAMGEALMPRLERAGIRFQIKDRI